MISRYVLLSSLGGVCIDVNSRTDVYDKAGNPKLGPCEMTRKFVVSYCTGTALRCNDRGDSGVYHSVPGKDQHPTCE